MSDIEHEPMPTVTAKPAVPITPRVIQDLRNKSKAGIEKYRVPLHTNNGRDPLRDAYQEVLDMAQYLKQRLVEADVEAGIELEPLDPDLDAMGGCYEYIIAGKANSDRLIATHEEMAAHIASLYDRNFELIGQLNDAEDRLEQNELEQRRNGAERSDVLDLIAAFDAVYHRPTNTENLQARINANNKVETIRNKYQ